MSPKYYAVQCIVIGEENPLKLPLFLGILFLSPCRRRIEPRSISHRQHAQKNW